MDYIELIQDTLNRIENNITSNLAIEQVSAETFISRYHFHRVFHAVVGITFERYVTSRRLYHSAILIKESNERILDVGMKYGFGSQAAYTRAFKRQFGITPHQFRKSSQSITDLSQATPVDRIFKNHNGQIIIDCKIIELPAMTLQGFSNQFVLEDSEKQKLIEQEGQSLVASVLTIDSQSIDHIYSIADPLGNGIINNFFGIDHRLKIPKDMKLSERKLHGGRYAVFKYSGNYSGIHDTVREDIRRWTEITNTQKTRSLERPCMQVFDPEYRSQGKYCIYIPI